jgi:hypothetical protein
MKNSPVCFERTAILYEIGLRGKCPLCRSPLTPKHVVGDFERKDATRYLRMQLRKVVRNAENRAQWEKWIDDAMGPGYCQNDL